ncbi:MFS transporter [Reyranella sp. CPCC 100927]|uniref:MFS transporter n=1 Tax=Reyranella sp. CPCC 100927 TaxID=2599616 RepID=UPI002104B9AB|nr:MFS transporter [Reyranella sp. CPCC 100927]
MERAIEDRWRHLLTRNLAPATATVCLGDALHALNVFITTTTMPSVVVELGGVSIIGWASTVFLVAAIVGGASAGFLKQRLGARPALIGAAAVFTMGTLCISLAPSMASVLVGRALQGAGDGVIIAACYALVAELFPARLVPKMFGLLAIIWAIAAFGGPLLAGLLTETTSWRVAYLVNLLLALTFAGLVAIVVPRTTRSTAPVVVPFGRLAAIAGGIMLVAVAGITGALAATVTLIVAALGVLIGVFVVDRSSPNKLFPSDAFSPRSIVGTTLWVVLLMPLAQACTTVYLPLFLQHLWGHGPTVAGSFTAITALSWSGAAMIVANIKAADLARITIRLGPILVAVGLAGASLALPLMQHWLLALCQVMIGAGFGVSWAFLNQAVMTNARPGETDTASGLVPTTQSAGYAIGAALFGLVAQSAGLSDALDPATIAHASRWLFGIAAAFALTAVVFGFAVRLRPADARA